MANVSEVETPEGANSSDSGSPEVAPVAGSAEGDRPAASQAEERTDSTAQETAEQPAEPAEPAAREPQQAGGGKEQSAQASETGASADTAGGDATADAAEATSSPGEVTAAGDVTSPGEEPAAKRKRRRRRKKKSEGEGEGEAEGKPTRRRKDAVAPFLRFFAGPNASAGKKHAFASGEVVAGRVVKVEHGAIIVDLFGKALAVADEFEPREVPPEPPPSVPEPVVDGEASALGAGASAVQDEVTPAEASADPAPAAEGEAPAPDEAASEQAAAEQSEPAGGASLAIAAQPAAEVAAASRDAQGSEDPIEGEPSIEARPVETEQSVQAEPAEAEPQSAGAEAADAEQSSPGGLAAPGEATGRGPLAPAPVVPADYPRPEPASQGQVFRGRVGAVSESGHIALVNRIVDQAVTRANIERYRAERRRVEGLVFGFNRGGFDVLIEGMRGFCPASAIALEEITDPLELVGRKLEFLLPTSQESGKDIVVSRRSILERQQRKRAKELLKSLTPGQRFKGRVTHVREFGLFIDIGGIEGLVHQSELSYAHGVKPGDVASPGDEIEVQVLRVGGPEQRKGDGKEAPRRDRVTRVSLSVKALLPDPWDEHAEALREGTVREGKVTRTTDFGAFLELAPQIEGLVHISELGRDLKHASQAVKEGETLHVVVERVDKKARRISLSKLSDAELEEYQQGQHEGGEPPRPVRPGSRITVKVDRVEHRGIVVRIHGVLGRRARGFIPNSEMGGQRGTDYRRSHPQGTEIEVKVIGIDRDGGLRCSPKALQIDEERRAVKDYRREAAKQGFGTFGDLLKAKLGGDPKP